MEAHLTTSQDRYEQKCLEMREMDKEFQSRLHALQSENSSLVDQVKQELAQTQNDLNVVQHEKQSMKTNLEKMTRQSQERDVVLTDLKTKLDRTRKDLFQATTHANSSEELGRSLLEELHQIRKRNDALSEEVTHFKQISSTLERKIQDADRSLKELESEKEGMSEQLESANQDIKIMSRSEAQAVIEARGRTLCDAPCLALCTASSSHLPELHVTATHLSMHCSARRGVRAAGN